jgi:hypothetical protein
MCIFISQIKTRISLNLLKLILKIPKKADYLFLDLLLLIKSDQKLLFLDDQI